MISHGLNILFLAPLAQCFSNTKGKIKHKGRKWKGVPDSKQNITHQRILQPCYANSYKIMFCRKFTLPTLKVIHERLLLQIYYRLQNSMISPKLNDFNLFHEFAGLGNNYFTWLWEPCTWCKGVQDIKLERLQLRDTILLLLGSKCYMSSSR